ncbi:CRAL-TRIO domain-containing protein isoform B [Neolecta irregularis DAH-3]|uniref:CRAL-TRIO domain-containing protein isoform B n=2 Tax=Neolecta irregularis (strain DAH-3) TaxID=1198029 RepID=A0A1U7LND2_NEOID|nr:CRAL-TRIO domain-containing protein isoform B [Neolecta irregularis DAH-3]|eukprot:OLL24157.1 CRAL-TRIO domain-containing protein isoform B [Neolecta irregularis DAH-3]
MSTRCPESITPRTTPFAKPDRDSQNQQCNVLTTTEIDAAGKIIEHFEKEDLSEDDKFWLTKECALRYYRASKTDICQAISRIGKTLTWRKEFRVSSITAQEIYAEAETGKQVLLGFDNAGHPILYLNPGRQNTAVSHRQLEYLVWGLERCIELMPRGIERLALCVNYKSANSTTSPGLSQSREVLNIVQNHYVERLGKAMVINMPWFITGFFKIISPFIDPLTRQKMVFNEDMRSHIPPRQLDSEFNGDLRFEYVHTEYWPCILEITQLRSEGMKRRWRELGACVGISEYDLKEGLEEEVDSKLKKEISGIVFSDKDTKGNEVMEKPEANCEGPVDQGTIGTAVSPASRKRSICVTEETEIQDCNVPQNPMSDTTNFVTAAENH